MTAKKSTQRIQDIFHRAINSRNYGRAISLYKKMLKLNPNQEDLWCKLGYSYKYYQLEASGKKSMSQASATRQALSCYRRALKINPNSECGLKGLIAYFADRGDQRALTLAWKLYKIKKRNPAYLMFVGHIYRDLGNLKKTEQYYRQALPAIPKHYGPYYALATLYCKMNNLKSAAHCAQVSLNRLQKMPLHYLQDRRIKKYRQELRTIIKKYKKTITAT